ncbi:MAG: 2-C-methyl-D-erythritol 2,4-cyclodiphosphate synthase [bacterium]|nr:2-C-methyl-D-erythritol 2,4-cyclodiphosphate synthase [bacterium]
MKNSLFRIGIGQDSHRLEKAKKDEALYLAGMPFLCNLKSVAHSDGDVILHALCNALSTALGGPSFSVFADQEYKKGLTDSKIYLQHFLEEMHKNNYQIANLSISVEALQPKLEAYNLIMKKTLAKILNIEVKQIGLAFTSGEGLTSCGSGEGISAIVTVLLEHE